MNSAMKPWITALMLAASANAAWAEGLSDPTRPPAVWFATQPGLPAVHGEEASSGVQMVLIGKTRRFAVIDGQIVKAGDVYNGSKVVGIGHDEIRLQGDDAAKSLKLAPAVEKKVRPPKSAKQAEQPASRR